MKNLLIVNLFSSAKYLSNALKQVPEINTIGVYSDFDKIDPYFKPSSDYFNCQIRTNNSDIAEVLSQINQPIDYVLNGSDQSVFLAEELAQRLTPEYSNSLTSSEIRCNKSLQQIALKQNGLPHIKEIQVNLNNIDIQSIDKLEYPVFAKPLNGAGSVGAFLAHSKTELLDGLNSATRKVIFTQVDEYLIQEYLQGEEIVVDTFSVKGEHFISNVYYYKKDQLDNRPVYRTAEIVTDLELRQAAINFTIATLNACQLENGFAHVELFMLGRNDFRLIELNPRISGAGGALQMLSKLVGGLSQDQLLINFLMGKDIYENSAIANKFGKVLFMYDDKPIDQSQYPSFNHSVIINREPLKLIEGKTLTLLDVHQIVLFVSNDQKVLENDISRAIANDVV